MRIHRYLFCALSLAYLCLVAIEIYVFNHSRARWAKDRDIHDDGFGMFTTLLIMIAGAYLLLLTFNAFLLLKSKQRTIILLASTILTLIPILLFCYTMRG